MNVISKPLREQLKIQKRKLSKIGFHELIMRTTDFRNTLLKYWVELSISISRIFKIIKCFVSSDVSISESFRSGHYSLLLKLLWLFNVNAVIYIREFKIIIRNPTQEKPMREIIRSKMIFCIEHTLIMYPVKTFPKTTYRHSTIDDDSSENSFENNSSENDFSDVNDEISRKDFWWVLNMI